MRESSRDSSGPDWTQHSLTALGGLAAFGGVVKFFGPSADEKVALYYLLTGGALLVLREVKTLSFGDWKLELQARMAEMRDELQRESPVNTMQPRAMPKPGGSRGHGFTAEKAALPEAGGTIDDNDPNKNQFGKCNSAGGLVLDATLKPAGDGSAYLDVKVVVRSEGQRRAPLTGAVDFFLHPSFPFPKRRVPVRNGRAILNLRAYGAFTIGAVADNGKTSLELDLMSVPGGTREFYEN